MYSLLSETSSLWYQTLHIYVNTEVLEYVWSENILIVLSHVLVFMCSYGAV